MFIEKRNYIKNLQEFLGKHGLLLSEYNVIEKDGNKYVDAEIKEFLDDSKDLPEEECCEYYHFLINDFIIKNEFGALYTKEYATFMSNKYGRPYLNALKEAILENKFAKYDKDTMKSIKRELIDKVILDSSQTTLVNFENKSAKAHVMSK